MYAIIETGGKQYRAEEGEEIDVELLHTTGPVVFDRVVLFMDGAKTHLGAPHVAHCKVHAEVIGESKGPKVIAFKYKKCKNYRRTVGHRQKYSRVKITKIAAS
jgi:large subunit ribosomal protein L21